MPTIGFIIAIVLGIIVSLLTKGNKNRVIDRNLVNMKVCRTAERILPQSWRQFQNEEVTFRGKSVDKEFTSAAEPNVYYSNAEKRNNEMQENDDTLPLKSNKMTFGQSSPLFDRTTNI